MNYHWNWKIFWEASPEGAGSYLSTLASGLGWTLATALTAWCMALVLGVAVGILRTLPAGLATRLGNGYVELFRNVPLLVQMFLWYFVAPELLPKALGDGIKQLPHASFLTAVVCLGFFTSARVAEQVRAGISSLPRGQAMAAMALGLTLPQSLRLIVLPQALRMSFAPTVGFLVQLIKGTSLAAIIGFVELSRSGQLVSSVTYKPLLAFGLVAACYFAICFPLSRYSARLEKRFAVAS